ncbi:MAG TPA: RES family NAD+ phosphorylase, partial [Rhizobiaceae bacterium]|nr:RES family NAD+ phosphorylase [Rhizobiaceae bacterium]
SRFRPAGHTPGVYYCSVTPETAAAEIAFYRLLFFAESPQTPIPRNPAEFTAFSVALATPFAIDLTQGQFALREAEWTRPADYTPCQALAGEARKAGIEIVAYRSVRDPQRGLNLAVLECAAFEQPAPLERQTWRISFAQTGVSAIREYPRKSIGFTMEDFSADPRLQQGRA